VTLPGLDEVLAGAHVVRLPMRVRFRGITEREALLVRGPVGWGEFAPFLEYDDAEAARWLAAALESGWVAPPAALREVVPVNATVPAVAAAQVAEVLARFPGCLTAKVKVAEPGQDLAQDVDRVAAVVDALGPGARVRVDANGAWRVDEAVAALRALKAAAGRADFEYAEQPCASIDELAALRKALARNGIDVPVAVDESIRKAADPLRVAVAGAADVVLLKVAPLGGIAAALEVAQVLGGEHGIGVVVSSALDTSVGIAAGVALAAALPELPYACGLGTVGLLARDIAVHSLVAADGVLPVGPVEVDEAALAELAAPEERRRHWLDRLARCHALLSGRIGG
jgi:O-succinylbenzoate synthase